MSVGIILIKGMFWAFAIVCSAHGGPLPMNIIDNNNNGKPVKILSHSPGDLASLGAISMSLTIINIIVIFIMGVLVLKVSGAGILYVSFCRSIMQIPFCRNITELSV